MPKAKNMHETDKDIKSEVFISGRHQEVPVDPADEFAQAHGITGFLEDLARGGNRKGFARIHLALGQ